MAKIISKRKLKVGQKYWAEGYTVRNKTIMVKVKISELLPENMEGYDCVIESIPSDGIGILARSENLGRPIYV